MSDIFERIAVRYMADLIRDFDLEDFQAAGFPGNMGVESAGFTDVTENNPTAGRGGLGHVQWTASRRVEFEAWLERRRQMGLTYAPDDYDANYSMVFRELEGGEGRRVLPKLRTARTVDEATEIVMTEYERPGAPHLEIRKGYGRRALAAFKATGIDVAMLRAQGRPGGGGVVVSTGSGTAQAPAGQLEQVLQQVLQSLIAAMLPLITNALTGALSGKPVVPLPAPAADASKPVPAGTSDTVKNWSTGILGALASLTASKFGFMGDPVGPASTTPGFLGVIAPLVGSALGAYAPILKVAGPFLSRLFGKG